VAKAKISAPDGTTIDITGTPDEIAVVVERIRRQSYTAAGKASPRGAKKARPPQLLDLIESLVDGDFFRKPQDLGAIKTALEELGHHYPVTTLSPTMLRQVRKRNLRRIKQDKRWFYTR